LNRSKYLSDDFYKAVEKANGFSSSALQFADFADFAKFSSGKIRNFSILCKKAVFFVSSVKIV
jgi:hypothetical protein